MPRNLFESASPSAKAGLKKASDNASVVAGLEMVASIKAVEDILAGVKELYEGNVKVDMHTRFVSEGARLHKRPENYKGKEGDASASLQLKKRSSVSKLDATEAEMLRALNVPVDTIADTFKINPEHAGNVELMDKINDALVAVEGVPDNLFVKETGKTIVSDESIESVFRMNDPDTISRLLPIVTTLAIRATLKDSKVETLTSAIKRVLAVLEGDVQTAEPSNKAKAKTEALPGFAKSKKKVWND